MASKSGVVLLALLSVAAACAQQPLVQGMNHTPIVVSKLEKAEADFRAMGFTIKPGRLHPDGIRNAHVKFADETELELITAPKSVNDLTSEYRRKLVSGEGPVYYGLYASDLAKVLANAHAAGLRLNSDDGLLTFPIGSPLHAVFFGRLEKVATDRSEYFMHRNTATPLSGFWVKDSVQLRDMFRVLNVPLAELPSCGAFPGRTTQATLPKGTVYLVSQPGPSDVLGAQVKVRSISTAQATLRNAGFEPQVFACDKASIWLPPSAAHGIWLQFTQSRH
jgi:glyoxalase-like protein